MQPMKRDKPFITVRRLLLGYDVTVTSLANTLGCCRNTARSRLERPETFTLHELEMVSIRHHIPMDEIRESIKR